MSIPWFRRLTLLLLLAAILAAPWTAAAAPRTESVQPAQATGSAPVELFSRVWSFLWSVWDKEGCHLDPGGLCPTGTSQPSSQTKEGCMIDPWGGCRH